MHVSTRFACLRWYHDVKSFPTRSYTLFDRSSCSTFVPGYLMTRHQINEQLIERPGYGFEAENLIITSDPCVLQHLSFALVHWQQPCNSSSSTKTYLQLPFFRAKLLLIFINPLPIRNIKTKEKQSLHLLYHYEDSYRLYSSLHNLASYGRCLAHTQSRQRCFNNQNQRRFITFERSERQRLGMSWRDVTTVLRKDPFAISESWGPLQL